MLRDMFIMVVKAGKCADKHCLRREVEMGSIEMYNALEEAILEYCAAHVVLKFLTRLIAQNECYCFSK